MHNITKMIDEVTGKEVYAMGSNKTSSWHGLGQYINKDALTSAEMLEASHLDWTVEKIPLLVHDKVNDSYSPIMKYKGQTKTDIPSVYGTFRRQSVWSEADKNGNRKKIGTELIPLTRDGNTVGNVYTILQNVDAFAFVDELLGDNSLECYETAGSLGQGEKVWLLVKIPSQLKIGKNGKDIIEPYICFTNTHDGTGSVHGFLTTVRVVCQNTLNMALRQTQKTTHINNDGSVHGSSLETSGAFKIRHTGQVMNRIDQARTGLGIVLEDLARMEVGINTMYDTKITKKQAIEFFEDALDAKVGKNGEITTAAKRVIDASVKALSHPTNKVDGMRGTAWAAFNALTYTLDHSNTIKMSGGKKGSNDMKKVEATIFGSVADKKEKAFQMLLSRCNTETGKYQRPKISAQ